MRDGDDRQRVNEVSSGPVPEGVGDHLGGCGARRIGREASSTTPAAARPAAVRNAAGIPLAAAMRPRTTGPPLSPRSMNALAVPAALPRWDGGTRLKMAANTAGVRKAVPIPSKVAPAKRLHAAGTAAMRTSPTPEAPSAAAARRSGGTRAGNVANRMRQAPTASPNKPSTVLPRARARRAPRRDANAQKPPTTAAPTN